MAYNPGGFPSNNYQPYGPPPSFPNRMFGQMPPPAWFYNMPDTRVRGGQYEPGMAFATPGGFNFGGGAAGMMANVALQMMTGGKPLPPFQGYDGGDLDYLRSRGRQGLGAASMPGNNNFGFDPMRDFGKVGRDPLLQQAFAMAGMTYGGDMHQASNIFAGRMGSSFGSTLRDQRTGADFAARQIRTQFSGAGGVYDYDRSFGFNLQDTADNMDSDRRYGGTRGNVGLGDAFREGRGGAMAAQINEKHRLGKATFGKDMSADAINDLITRATGSIENISPERATTFLAKVQSTARALDMNAKAFAEFMAMQQNVYKTMGIGGAMSSDSIMHAAMAGESAVQAAQHSGSSVVLGDKQTAMGAAARNTAARQGSALLNQARAVAAISTNLSPDQRASLRVGGQSIDGAIQRMAELINNGQDAEAGQLINQIARTNGFGSTYTLAAHMNEEITSRAAGVIDISKGVRGSSVTVRGRAMRHMTNKLDSADRALIKQKGGLGEILDGTDNITDAATISAALQAKQISKTDADRMAQTVSTAALNYESVAGRRDLAGYKEHIHAGGAQGRAEAIANAEKTQLEANKSILINRRMGSIGKSLGLEDGTKAGGIFLREMEGKGLTKDALMKAAAAAGVDLSGKNIAQIEALAAEGGGFDAVSRKAEDAYRAALPKGGIKAARAARQSVLDEAQGMTASEREIADKQTAAREAEKADAAVTKAAGLEKTEGFLEQLVNLVATLVEVATSKGKDVNKGPEPRAETDPLNSTP